MGLAPVGWEGRTALRTAAPPFGLMALGYVGIGRRSTLQLFAPVNWSRHSERMSCRARVRVPSTVLIDARSPADSPSIGPQFR
jgi:hypothetical protein